MNATFDPRGAQAVTDAAEDYARLQAAVSLISRSVDMAVGVPEGRRVIGEALCAALDQIAPDSPTWGLMREISEREAAWWADAATPLAVEKVIVACLRRMERATLAERGRKALFMALWRSFTKQQQADFLAAMGREAKPP